MGEGKGGQVLENRILLWDILKGIGIISIVFGHSQNSGTLIRMVYYYHLAIFFFVSGYFYQEEKYQLRPFEFFTRRLQGLWGPYVFYGVIFALLHNVFVKLSMFPEALYGKQELLREVVDVMLLDSHSLATGAMWFVPSLLVTCALFGGIMWVSHRFLPGKAGFAAVGVLSCLAGLLGVIINNKNIILPYHIHTSLVVLPVYYAGYWLQKKRIDVSKFATWYIALACAVFYYYFLVHTSYKIDLAERIIPPGIFFYLFSAAGICLCCYAAKWIQKIPPLGRGLALIGTYSFDIMALHFVVMKVVDSFYGHIILHAPKEVMASFPHAFRELHVIYLVLGVGVSMMLGYLGRKIYLKR